MARPVKGKREQPTVRMQGFDPIARTFDTKGEAKHSISYTRQLVGWNLHDQSNPLDRWAS